MSDKPPTPDRSHRVQIALAVIGAIGALGAALFANWDKVVGSSGGAAPASKPAAPATSTQGDQSPVVSGVTGNVTIQIGNADKPASSPAVVDIGGRWVSGELQSPYATQWKSVLTFEFVQQGETVLGSVTERIVQPHEREVSRPLSNGRLQGGTVSFETHSEVLLGQERRPYTETYIGTLRDGALHFTRQNDTPTGGAVERFVARRP
jgi:hypothetical protein